MCVWETGEHRKRLLGERRDGKIFGKDTDMKMLIGLVRYELIFLNMFT